MAQVQTSAAPSFDVNTNTLTASKTFWGPATRAYTIIGGQVTWGVASTSVVFDMTKDTGTTAPAGGSTVLSATVDTSTTANTATALAFAVTTIAIGDRLAIKITGTVGSLANLSCNVSLQPA